MFSALKFNPFEFNPFEFNPFEFNLFNATLLSSICNQALNLDPQKEYLLEKLNAKSLTIIIRDWHKIINITPTSSELIISNELPEISTDCTLKGSLSDLIQMGLSEEPQSFIQNGTIEQSGNFHVLSSYQTLYSALDIDWEHHLAQKIGVMPAHVLLKPFKMATKWLKNSNQKFTHELDDYLHEETKLFPPREEINDFFEDIQALQNDLDRLEARINLLSKKTETKNETH